MSDYIPFTEAQKENARQTDLVAFLRLNGETVLPSGSEFQWLHNGQKITIRRNLWYNQYERVGGDAIAFAEVFYNYSYQEAVTLMLAMQCYIDTAPETSHPAKEFELPPKHDNMRRVYAYLLRHRGIDKEVLDAFIYKKMIYESAEHHNVVFVGYDKEGNPRHAHKRGSGTSSTYKGNAPASSPDFSFHWIGGSDTLYLFEAPVDLLSFISMNKRSWRNHSYAAACSISDIVLWQCLHDYPYIKRVGICFDNDKYGQEAAQSISEKLTRMNIENKILVPVKKDWNEDLLSRKEAAA